LDTLKERDGLLAEMNHLRLDHQKQIAELVAENDAKAQDITSSALRDDPGSGSVPLPVMAYRFTLTCSRLI
jgi:hypothetical protein